jgi:hypothetical protein
MLAKVRCVRHVPGTKFRGLFGNASHWLMQTGDRHSAVPGGQMLAKVRCDRHVPGTSLGAPGAMLANG